MILGVSAVAFAAPQEDLSHRGITAGNEKNDILTPFESAAGITAGNSDASLDAQPSPAFYSAANAALNNPGSLAGLTAGSKFTAEPQVPNQVNQVSQNIQQNSGIDVRNPFIQNARPLYSFQNQVGFQTQSSGSAGNQVGQSHLSEFNFVQNSPASFSSPNTAAQFSSNVVTQERVPSTSFSNPIGNHQPIYGITAGNVYDPAIDPPVKPASFSVSDSSTFALPQPIIKTPQSIYTQQNSPFPPPFYNIPQGAAHGMTPSFYAFFSPGGATEGSSTPTGASLENFLNIVNFDSLRTNLRQLIPGTGDIRNLFPRPTLSLSPLTTLFIELMSLIPERNLPSSTRNYPGSLRTPTLAADSTPEGTLARRVRLAALINKLKELDAIQSAQTQRERADLSPTLQSLQAHQKTPSEFIYSGGPTSRSETRDANGVVRGTYSYFDGHGEVQKKDYIVDSKGFRFVSNANVPQSYIHF